MAVVSTSNLISLETKKTTACDFKTMHSFVMSHALMRGQIRSHAENRFLIHSFMMAEL